MGIEKVVLPAMGEGVFEATITQWLVKVGDFVAEDDSLVEIATDKVDSEIPSPVTGKIKEILVQSGEIAKIGQAVVAIEIENAAGQNQADDIDEVEFDSEKNTGIMPATSSINSTFLTPNISHKLSNGAFLSPLVRRIAEKEQLTNTELLSILGTGINNRITKDDVVAFIDKKSSQATDNVRSEPVNAPNNSIEIIEMTRMRSLIASNMVRSKQVAPHVTSFHEVDVTNIVNWRNKIKDIFYAKYKQKLTFTPIFLEAVALAIKEYPMINVSVVDNKIHRKINVNIGLATALPDGNLIVPVIKEADTLSLSGLASKVNDLALRARNKQLKPDEIQGGTFTITNVGSFGNLSGTPIINQPEVAILAIGAIKKRPAVIETPHGDLIGIRHQMILSLSYDHRVVDGSLGGMFLKKVADILEAFNSERII